MGLNLLVGHRGSGKSSLLKRLARYSPKSVMVDLDFFVEQQAGESISEIFRRRGEQGFRELEREALQNCQLQAQQGFDVWVALGAGYEGELPREARVFWIRRESDRFERFFFDRPRLENYSSRISARETRYKSWSKGQVLTLREGFEEAFDPGETAFFKSFLSDERNAINLEGASLTLDPLLFQQSKSFIRDYFEQRLKWNLRYFEIRSDLHSLEDAKKVLESLNPKHLLVSFRNHPAHNRTYLENLSFKGLSVDWDLNLGPVPPQLQGARELVLSLHDGSIGQILTRFLSMGTGPYVKFKAAPRVSTFRELKMGHEWYRNDPQRRAFLPRSLPGAPESRWAWYRLNQKAFMWLNFVREGAPDPLLGNFDQPLLLDWIAALGRGCCFGAILGSPLEQSRSVATQEAFFQKHFSADFYRVPVTREDAEPELLTQLKGLGLIGAAVTSPLKSFVFENANHSSELSKKLKAANTLWLKDGQWCCENTDLYGAMFLFEGLDLNQGVAVIGGGGTKGILQALLPQATFLNARDLCVTQGTARSSYQVLVWAAGDHEVSLPDSLLSFCQHFVDLDYRLSSAGRRVFMKVQAMNPKSVYRSGMEMFKVQAERQQSLWARNLVVPSQSFAISPDL